MGRTLTAAVLLLRSGSLIGDDTIASIEDKRRSVAGMLRLGARETSFATFWVAVAYLVTTRIITVGGIDVATIAAISGIAGVSVGAGVSQIPGFAVQVVLTGLYARAWCHSRPWRPTHSARTATCCSRW